MALGRAVFPMENPDHVNVSPDEDLLTAFLSKRQCSKLVPVVIRSFYGCSMNEYYKNKPHVQARMPDGHLDTDRTLSYRGSLMIYDQRGAKVGTENLSIHVSCSYSLIDNIVLTADPKSRGYYRRYFWSSTKKQFSLRECQHPYYYGKRKAKRQNKRNISGNKKVSDFAQTALLDWNTYGGNLNPRIKWGRRGRMGYKTFGNLETMQNSCEMQEDTEEGNREDTESENEFKHDEYEDYKPPHGRPYLKPIPRKWRKLLLDKPVIGKHSKARMHHLALLTSDSFHMKVREKDINFNSNMASASGNTEETERERSPSSLTLGMFFSESVATRLGLNDMIQAHSSDLVPDTVVKTSKDDLTEGLTFSNETKVDGISTVHGINDKTLLNTPERLDACDRTSNAGVKSNTKLDTEVSDSPARVSNEQSEVATPKSMSDTSSSSDELSYTNYVLAKLPRAMVRPDSLREEFRSDYREAACKPRRFVINISRLLYHHATLVNRLRLRLIPKLDLSTYLIFAFYRESDSDVDEYRVWMSSSWSRVRAREVFKNIDENKTTQIQHLIQDAVRAIDKCNINTFKTKPQPDENPHTFVQRPVCDFATLKSVTKWETDSICIPYTTEWCENKKLCHMADSKSSETVMVDILNVLKGNVSAIIPNPGPKDPSICGMCLTNLKTASLSTQTFPLALTLCSHWFCELCWKSGILIQIRKEQLPCDLVCLEDGCQTKIDPTVLLTLLKVKDIRQFSEARIKKYAKTTPWLKRCPNTPCKRLLMAKAGKSTSNLETITVVCPCSCQVCFVCLRTPHWPANCQEAENYHMQLEQRDDNMLHRTLTDNEFPEVVLRGKRCPRCGIFILQNGSSHKSETCSCGCEFCWACGREISKTSTGIHAECLEIFEHSDKTLKENINKSTQTAATGIHDKCTKWYRVAVSHRKMRNPQVVSALYAMADNVAMKIASVAVDGRYIGDTSKAARGCNESFRNWAKENLEMLEADRDLDFKTYSLMPSMNHGEDPRSRPVSRGLSSAMSCFSRLSFSDEPEPVGLDIKLAADSIVQTKLELHHIIEYTAAMLNGSMTQNGKLSRCLDRAEDLCTVLGIQLQDPHAHNAHRIIPTFLRIRTQIKQVVRNILAALGETSTAPAGSKPV